MQQSEIDEVLQGVTPNKSLANMLFAGTAQEILMGAAGQEKFCRLVAAGFTHAHAYAEAYEMADKGDSRAAINSIRLMRQPHIVARIMQLRASSVKGLTVNRDLLLEPLLWALNTARDRGNTDQVRKIVMDIGKLFGLVIDRMEAEVSGQFQVMRDVTVEGSTLMFDIGSGQTVSVRGDKVAAVEGAQAAFSLTNPSNAIKRAVENDEHESTKLTENDFKRDTDSAILEISDELPPEALLDALIDLPKPTRKGRVSKRDMDMQAAIAEEQAAAWGEDDDD